MSIKTRIVSIGNSRGVRIPKRLLDMAGLPDDVELDASKGRIVIRAAIRPRDGWDTAFARMAGHGDDALLAPPTPTEWDETEWTWDEA